jgi:hypothetical protein
MYDSKDYTNFEKSFTAVDFFYTHTHTHTHIYIYIYTREYSVVEMHMVT